MPSLCWALYGVHYMHKEYYNASPKIFGNNTVYYVDFVHGRVNLLSGARVTNYPKTMVSKQYIFTLEVRGLK